MFGQGFHVRLVEHSNVNEQTMIKGNSWNYEFSKNFSFCFHTHTHTNNIPRVFFIRNIMFFWWNNFCFHFSFQHSLFQMKWSGKKQKLRKLFVLHLKKLPHCMHIFSLLYDMRVLSLTNDPNILTILLTYVMRFMERITIIHANEINDKFHVHRKCKMIHKRRQTA